MQVCVPHPQGARCSWHQRILEDRSKLVAPTGSLPTRGRLFSVSKRLGGENRVSEAAVGGCGGPGVALSS